MNIFNGSAILLLILHLLVCIEAHNKYSENANKPKEEDNADEVVLDLRPSSLKHLDRPFRMAKLNLLWTKAVVRLSEPKLRSLFGELQLHDKEEITWKHLRAEGKDKDGLKEAELRKKLLAIMANYELSDQTEDVHNPEKVKPYRPLNEAGDKHINKSLFKDKKLNKLWLKAEIAGFTAEELQALKEEFDHHQDKIDQYYSLLDDVRGNEVNHDENSVDDELDKFNQIDQKEEEPPKKDYIDKVNLLRENNKQIKDGYDHLHVLAAKGPASREFVEPKVNGLWKIAVESNFSHSELESLRIELKHYENRLLKLRHIQAEHALTEAKHKGKIPAGDKQYAHSVVAETIKKQARKVEKIHLELETRIMQKHIEL
ncbi:unnamed protein product [Brassicogethes aeneus]|uniref:Alpha-2-macroglobulin receptor-associated protein n=1 Tax=Brassicogethes aeneus TaxID=1431903 RepID=A0A9P0AZX8_BRAAE|nr:unnamed protein product [Brassicogethes aeneus]